MKRNLAYLFGTAIILLALYASQGVHSDFIPPPPDLNAAPGDNADLNGYAWSSNIGWISMNCLTGALDGADSDTIGDSRCGASPYKVTINTNPNGDPMLLSGYGWSANVGWITFSFPVDGGRIGDAYLSVPRGRTNCPLNADAVPVPDCRARIQKDATGKYDFQGWARACAVFQSGCSGALKPAPELGGWDGWISLSCYNEGNCSGAPYGLDVVGNGVFRSVYSWGSDVIGWFNWSGVSFTPPCSNVGESCNADGVSFTTRDQWCEEVVTTCAAGNVCTQAGADASCIVGVPAGTFSASPARVRKGTEVTLSWNVTNVGTCTIAATPTLSSGQSIPLVTVDPVTASASSSAAVAIDYGTTFTLTCRDVANGNERVIDTKEVNVLPTLEYI